LAVDTFWEDFPNETEFGNYLGLTEIDGLTSFDEDMVDSAFETLFTTKAATLTTDLPITLVICSSWDCGSARVRQYLQNNHWAALVAIDGAVDTKFSNQCQAVREAAPEYAENYFQMQAPWFWADFDWCSNGDDAVTTPELWEEKIRIEKDKYYYHANLYTYTGQASLSGNTTRVQIDASMAKWRDYILDDTYRKFLQQWMTVETVAPVLVVSPDMQWVNYFFRDNPLDSVDPYLSSKRAFYTTDNQYGVYYNGGVHNDFYPSTYLNAVREAQLDSTDPWYMDGLAYDATTPDKARYSELGMAAMWGYPTNVLLRTDRAYTTYFNNRVAAYERLLKWAAGDTAVSGGSKWALYTDNVAMMRAAYKEGQGNWLQHILDFESLGFNYGDNKL